MAPAGALAAAVLPITVAAHAGPVPETSRTPVGISDMQAGRLLLGAGRLEAARAFLLQARPAGEAERVERRFRLGRIEMRLGRPGQAAECFGAVLARRPDLTRVRLELAPAYSAAGPDDKANDHYDGRTLPGPFAPVFRTASESPLVDPARDAPGREVARMLSALGQDSRNRHSSHSIFSRKSTRDRYDSGRSGWCVAVYRDGSRRGKSATRGIPGCGGWPVRGHRSGGPQ